MLKGDRLAVLSPERLAIMRCLQLAYARGQQLEQAARLVAPMSADMSELRDVPAEPGHQPDPGDDLAHPLDDPSNLQPEPRQ